MLSDCQGAFGSFDQQDLAGVVAAISQFAGGKPVNPNNPRAGWTGGAIGGHPLKLVGIGCSNDQAATAIQQTRKLMEQDGADIMIGPLSGDESIAVANYAKQHPDKTFVDGAAGAQDTTLKVKAPNFFRFNGDGAQWNAGLGDIAYNKLHWRTAAVVSDDYSFGWTSTAGFIADFCAAGGQITQRVFPPLNTTDYSSYAQQIKSNVDGIFVAVGGSGLIPFLKAYEQAKGPIDPKKFMGNLFWDTPGLFGQLGPRVAGAYAGSAGTAGDLAAAAPQDYRQQHHGSLVQDDSARGRRGSAGIEHLHVWLLRQHVGADQGAGGRQGQHRRRSEGSAGRDRQGRPARAVRHDQARPEPPGDLHQLQPAAVPQGRQAGREDRRRDPGRHPVVRRDVQQLDAGSGTDRARVCEAQPPLAGPRPVGEDTRLSPVHTMQTAVPNTAEPILQLRGVGRRFGGLAAVSDVDLDVAPGERRAILGPNGAGKTTLFNLISGDIPVSSGTIAFLGADLAVVSAAGRTKRGIGRTYQKSRLFSGLSVEDNLFLAVLGTRGGHFRVRRTARDRELRDRARELAGAVGLQRRVQTLVGSLSHGEQRQLEVGMARASEPKLMLLDEPASGLSRGERTALTDLLLGLDSSITLMLIEHDMDVALRVAERVTMMHDGRKIVEGTPDEIRSNQLVHELYLGGRVTDEGIETTG